MEKLLIEHEVDCDSVFCGKCEHCRIITTQFPKKENNRIGAECDLFRVNLEFLPNWVYRHNDCLACSRRWRDLALPRD